MQNESENLTLVVLREIRSSNGEMQVEKYVPLPDQSSLVCFARCESFPYSSVLALFVLFSFVFTYGVWLIVDQLTYGYSMHQFPTLSQGSWDGICPLSIFQTNLQRVPRSYLSSNNRNNCQILFYFFENRAMGKHNSPLKIR